MMALLCYFTGAFAVKRFTEAGRKALSHDNFYAALSLALTLPDICASLEDPGPGKSEKRYKRWCDKWLVPKFTSVIGANGKEHVFITADDCWKLRNSLIHSGSTILATSSPQRMEFFDRSTRTHMVSVDMTVDGVDLGNTLVLQTDLFSENIFQAVEEWDEAMKGAPAVQAEKAKLLVIRTSGHVMFDGVMRVGR